MVEGIFNAGNCVVKKKPERVNFFELTNYL